MPLSIQELGARTKTKYPQYASLSDEEVGQKVSQKYPQYQSQISAKDGGIVQGVKNFAGGTANIFSKIGSGIGTAAEFVGKNIVDPIANIPNKIMGQESVNLFEEGGKAIKDTSAQLSQSIRGEAPSAFTGKTAGIETDKNSNAYKAGNVASSVAAQVPGLVGGGQVLKTLPGVGTTFNAANPARSFTQKAISGVTKSVLGTEQSAAIEEGRGATLDELTLYGGVDLLTAGIGSKMAKIGKTKGLTKDMKKVADKLDEFIKPTDDVLEAEALYGRATPGRALAEANKLPRGKSYDAIRQSTKKLIDTTGREIDNALTSAKGTAKISTVDSRLAKLVEAEIDPTDKATLNSLVGAYWTPIKKRLGDNPTYKQMWVELKNLEKKLPRNVLSTPTADLPLASRNAMLKVMKKEITSTMRGMIHEGVEGITTNLNAYQSLELMDDTLNKFIKAGRGTSQAGQGLESLTFSKENIIKRIVKAVLPKKVEQKLLPDQAQQLDAIVSRLTRLQGKPVTENIISKYAKQIHDVLGMGSGTDILPEGSIKEIVKNALRTGSRTQIGD